MNIKFGRCLMRARGSYPSIPWRGSGLFAFTCAWIMTIPKIASERSLRMLPTAISRFTRPSRAIQRHSDRGRARNASSGAKPSQLKMGSELNNETRPLASASRDVLHFQTQPWSGINAEDTASERQLIQQFLFDLIDAIAEIAQAEQAPIHFYVYSRSEMTSSSRHAREPGPGFSITSGNCLAAAKGSSNSSFPACNKRSITDLRSDGPEGAYVSLHH